MNLTKNYYGILGVSNTSDEKTIKKAYYKLSFTHHPDKVENVFWVWILSNPIEILSIKLKFALL